MEKNLISKAIIFATKAHEGTMRKGSDIPYILHPLETGVIVSEMTSNPVVISAAILHDVLEDTDATFEELKNEFGEAASYVSAETENKRREFLPEQTWKIRKQETIEHLKQEKRIEVKMIALADKLSNIRSISRDYQELSEKLWERFHEKRKSEHAWYYKQLVWALEDLKEYRVYHEYVYLVEQVFGK